MSETIIRKGAGRLMGLMGLVVLMMAWTPIYSFGNEITSNPPGGKTSPGPLAQLSDKQILEKLDQLQQRIERLERKLEESGKTGPPPVALPSSERKQEEAKGTGTSSVSEPSKASTVHEQLLKEELGRVEGVILWQGKPLAKGKVRIELEKYTGVSWASVKKMFSENGKESYESDQGVFFSTETDSQGRYAFQKVPPGTYRLYWWPDFKTGWVHRLREKPDFEVTSGRLTTQNIPEKPSVLKVKGKN